jgi:hypothetical protein
MGMEAEVHRMKMKEMELRLSEAEQSRARAAEGNAAQLLAAKQSMDQAQVYRSSIVTLLSEVIASRHLTSFVDCQVSA